MQKAIHFIGSAQDDLRGFSEETRREFGQGLYIAERGGRPLNAISLTGFGSASITELRTNDKGGTYRCIYTVQYEDALYVLHAFKKKSKTGIKTPKKDTALIRSRLKLADEHYEKNYRIREEERRKKRQAT